MDATATLPAAPQRLRRPWFQFGLRAMLVLLLAAAVPLGWLAHELRLARNQKEAVRQIHDLDGIAMACPNFAIPEKSWMPAWLQKALTDDDFASVNYVTLHGAEVTDARLAQLCIFPQLRSLQVRSCPVSDAGLECLRRLPSLEALTLTDVNVTDQGIGYVCGLPRLESLHLRSTGITDTALAEISRLSHLSRLRLENSQVTDRGIEHLLQMPQLESLSLKGSKVTDRGLVALQRLTQLERLDVRDTQVTDAGVAELRRAMPKLRIE